MVNKDYYKEIATFWNIFLGYCCSVVSTSWIYNQINGESANDNAFVD